MSRFLFLLLLLAAPAVFCAELPPAPPAPEDFYKKAMADLSAAKDDYGRWCALGRAAKESLRTGHDADAKAFAEELSRLAPKYTKDWNFGNAWQDFNIVLGRIAIKTGELEAAKTYLLAAGHSPGSPQMNSFGPNMTLASELLGKGEKTVVIEYFKLCAKFWKMDRGRLDQWTKDIEEGRAPQFGANLLY